MAMVRSGAVLAIGDRPIRPGQNRMRHPLQPSVPRLPLRCGLILLIVALSGCAQLAAAPVAGLTTTPAVNPPARSAAAAPAPATTAPPPAAGLPNVPLTPDVLYQLMMSEIAAQRGLTGPAQVTLFELAQRTRDPRIARRAFEMALLARQSANALRAARLWAELAPEVSQARDSLLNMLVVNNQFIELESLLRSDLAKSANPGETFGAITALLARSSRQVEALAVMEGLAADFPRLPEAQLAVAQTARLANNLSRAMVKIRAALTLRPDWELAALVGAQYLQQDAPQEAVEILKKFLENSPRSAAVRVALGRLLASQQRYPEAVAEFRSVLELEPRQPDARFALGMIAAQTKQPDEAERQFKLFLDAAQSARRPDRNVSRALLQLAQIEEDRKNPAGALEYLGRITEGEEFVPARARRASLLARSGRLEEALRELREADVNARSERVQLIQVESQLLREHNRLEDAFTALDNGLRNFPEEPDLLYDHAMAAEKLNRLDVMEASLRTLIRLRPEAAHAYNALGYSLADRKLRLPEARALIEKALSLAPDDAAILDSMGWVLFRQGEHLKALEYLRRAYAARPDAEVGTHLGEVLWVLGRHEEARQMWREAGAREPQNEVLRETLTRLNVQLPAH